MSDGDYITHPVPHFLRFLFHSLFILSLTSSVQRPLSLRYSLCVMCNAHLEPTPTHQINNSSLLDTFTTIDPQSFPILELSALSGSYLCQTILHNHMLCIILLLTFLVLPLSTLSVPLNSVALDGI